MNSTRTRNSDKTYIIYYLEISATITGTSTVHMEHVFLCLVLGKYFHTYKYMHDACIERAVLKSSTINACPLFVGLGKYCYSYGRQCTMPTDRLTTEHRRWETLVRSYYVVTVNDGTFRRY